MKQVEITQNSRIKYFAEKSSKKTNIEESNFPNLLKTFNQSMRLQVLAEYPIGNPVQKPIMQSFNECINITNKVIKRMMPSEAEHMEYNDKISNIFKTILAKPANNVFRRIYGEVCAAYGSAGYTYVLALAGDNVVKTSQKQISIRELKTIMQKAEEEVQAYAQRYYEVLNA
uniref:CRISPR type III-B/RAMP module-associated protein Cmr5 n=1 Tax=Strongyloides venezuelensis TaxID=75913 RepID=A0A0K0FPK7_STRVS